jgi:hypothetical protein
MMHDFVSTPSELIADVVVVGIELVEVVVVVVVGEVVAVVVVMHSDSSVPPLKQYKLPSSLVL